MPPPPPPQDAIKKRNELEGEVAALKTRVQDGFGMARMGGFIEPGEEFPRQLLIDIHGFRGKDPAERAIMALHEKRELLERYKHYRKGYSAEAMNRIGTDSLGIPNAQHQNVVVPFYDLNIARTLTGEGSENVARRLQALRAPEIEATKDLLPEVAPILDQLTGRGVAYGTRAKPNYVRRAEAILSGAVPSSEAAKRRAQYIVDTHVAGNAPNVRLNRREIDYIRQLSDRKFSGI